MRKLFAAIVGLCLLYFLGGWAAVHLSWIARDDYFLFAGIVGALASVVGLISFVRPPPSRINLKDLELESLQSITAMTERIHTLEQEKAKTEGEIEDLDIKKKEMELLVRKASFSLFLKERLSYHEKQILELTRGDMELSRHLEEVQDIRQKLTVLNEEIQSDPNVLVLEEIIRTASERQLTHDDVVENLPISMQVALSVVRLISGMTVNLGKTPRK